MKWFSGYLFFCGLLFHFAAVVVVLALALFSPSQRNLEPLAQTIARPLENSKDCSIMFRGQVFEWQKASLFELPFPLQSGITLAPYYKNLGLRGQMASGHDVFQVGFDLEILDERGLRRIAKPHGNAYFEVDSQNKITQCHVQGGENRAFDCLLERGQLQPNRDCLMPVASPQECASAGGRIEAPRQCRFAAHQPIPNLVAQRASAQARDYEQACEQPGWFRTLNCIEGRRFCRAKTLCRWRHKAGTS